MILDFALKVIILINLVSPNFKGIDHQQTILSLKHKCITTHSVLKGGLRVQAIPTECFFLTLDPLALVKNLMYVTTFSYSEFCAIHLFVKAIYFPDFGNFLHKKRTINLDTCFALNLPL